MRHRPHRFSPKSEGEKLAVVIARQFDLSPHEAESAIEIARREVGVRPKTLARRAKHRFAQAVPRHQFALAGLYGVPIAFLAHIQTYLTSILAAMSRKGPSPRPSSTTSFSTRRIQMGIQFGETAERPSAFHSFAGQTFSILSRPKALNRRQSPPVRATF
jgi:hypothetical protein